MQLKTGLFLTLFLFTLQATRIKDASNGDLSGIRNVKYRHFLESSRPSQHLSSGRVSLDLSMHRVKRSVLFSTGVKVCPQESMAEVISSHKAYYKLRVCQEAVWEAFQIFLDRVPDTEEYQQWVFACQRDSLCVDDLARNFSSTQEHLDMVARGVSAQEDPDRALATPPPGEKCAKTPGDIFATDSGEPQAPVTVPVELVEHVIEFSVTVEDPAYSELLNDPDTAQYQYVTHSLHDQMLQIFSKLPGFKEIRLLGFQSEGVPMRYAVVFETEGDTLDDSIGEISLKDRVVKALSEDASLPLDIHSLSFDPVPPTYNTKYLPGDTSTHTTVVTSRENTEPASIANENVDAKESGIQETLDPLPPETTLATVSKEPPSDLTGGPKVVESEEGNLITEEVQVTKGPKKNTSLSEVLEDLGNEIVVTASSAASTTQPKVDFVTVAEDSHIRVTEVPKKEDNAGHLEIPAENSPEPPEPTRPKEIPTEFSSLPSTIEIHPVHPVDHPSSATTLEPVPPVDIPSAPSSFPVTSETILEEEVQSLKTESPQTPEKDPNSGTDMQEDVEDTEEGESDRFPPETDEHPQSSAPPVEVTTPLIIAASKAKELVVFFSLRVTDMIFSENLFNKSSPEYKTLENTFLELLLPYLQSNLTGFKELEIINFKNGSVVVNSKMKLAKPVPYNISEAVHCVLEDFCNAASKRLDIEIDTESVDIAAGDDSDPCKYFDCNQFSRCVVNTLSGEPQCLCDPGYSMVEGLPCQSICDLEPDYCLNEGICEIIPGHGATCRCPVGKFWHYHGERCNELVSVPIDPFLFVACLVGSLTMVCAVIGILIFVNKKCIRTRKTVTLVHSHSTLPLGGTMRVNPSFENDEGLLTHVSSISYPVSTDSGSSQLSDQGTFLSFENMHLSAEMPRQLYTRRSEKLVPEMVTVQHCIPHHDTWRLSNNHRTPCCLLRGPDSEGFEVTIL